MIYYILGYENDREVNETILGLFLSFFATISFTMVKYDYVEYLVGAINYQLSTHPIAKSFLY